MKKTNLFITILAGAAAAVAATGTLLKYALVEEAIKVGMTCEQWCDASFKYEKESEKYAFFFAINEDEDFPPPAVFEDRVVGNCDDGACVIQPYGCDGSCEFSYSYSQSTEHGGWSIVLVEAPKYFAGSWKSWADATILAKWLGSWNDYSAECQTVASEQNCLDALSEIHECWMLADTAPNPTPPPPPPIVVPGYPTPDPEPYSATVNLICRHGHLYGPGEGGNNTCAVGLGSSPVPCVSPRGAPGFEADITKTYEDEDLNKF